MRYYLRLLSVYFEIMNIREDFFRDRFTKVAHDAADPSVPKTDAYFYSYRHNLRTEDIRPLGDEVYEEILKIRELLAVLESRPCLSIRPVRRSRGTLEQECAEAIKKVKLPAKPDFDDLKYWLKLPLPWGVIPDDIKQNIELSNASPASRDLYNQYLYRFWIERLEQLRCRLFLECLTQERRTDYFNLIKASN